MFSGVGLFCFDGGIILSTYGRTLGCEIKVSLSVYVQVFSILRVSGWSWLAGHGGICD